jgi:hypothetical protein
MSKSSIEAINLTAQLSHRADGNPPCTLPNSAISNSFPGLECDFRNVWRRIFEGIVLHESDNYVVAAERKFATLKGRRLLFVEDEPIIVPVRGPAIPGRDTALGFAALEWSNALATKLTTPGAELTCYFTKEVSAAPIVLDPLLMALDSDTAQAAQLKRLREEAVKQRLRIRSMFAKATGEALSKYLPVIARELLEPGELSQSLCSPWQNDYRECACYYWAASRPDFVNVEAGPDGLSRGQNWMMKDRDKQPKEYLPDDRQDSRLYTYTELFLSWQKLLKFEIGGRDVPE